MKGAKKDEEQRRGTGSQGLGSGNREEENPLPLVSFINFFSLFILQLSSF